MEKFGIETPKQKIYIIKQILVIYVSRPNPTSTLFFKDVCTIRSILIFRGPNMNKIHIL